MKLTKLVIAIATFATITLSSSAYIATKEVTSAVLVDKAKHSLDLTTNGLHNISVSEAFTIDKSEAAQINFLRCSFARPEFRFSWFCHQQKIDGKMTKNSYVALKDDQQKYFKTNVFKSIAYEARKLFEQAEQLSTLAKIQRSNKNAIEKAKASGVNGEARAVESVEQGGRELSKAGTETVIRKNISDAQAFAVSPLTEIDRVSIQELFKRLGDTEIPSEIKDLDPDTIETLRNLDKGLLANMGLFAADTHENKNTGVGKHILSAVLLLLVAVSIGCTIQEFTGENKVARQLESWKQSVKVMRKKRYKLLRTAKPFSKEAEEISELDIKIEELDNKIAKLKEEVKGKNHE
jgi:hypothetical protein